MFELPPWTCATLSGFPAFVTEEPRRHKPSRPLGGRQATLQRSLPGRGGGACLRSGAMSFVMGSHLHQQHLCWATQAAWDQPSSSSDTMALVGLSPCLTSHSPLVSTEARACSQCSIWNVTEGT